MRAGMMDASAPSSVTALGPKFPAHRWAEATQWSAKWAILGR